MIDVVDAAETCFRILADIKSMPPQQRTRDDKVLAKLAHSMLTHLIDMFGLDEVVG
jgi:hypothetical protein